MTKVITESIGTYSHHYPKVAAVVTAQAEGKENAMAVAWHSSISIKPPLYGVAITPRRFTYEVITESNEFGINFLPFEVAELVASVGGSGGRMVDKFQRFNIAKDESVKTAVPILKAAYAAYECKLVDDRAYGDHRWLVGEIVAVHLLEDVLTPAGVLDLDKISPALYMGHELYLTVSKDSVQSLDREVYGKR